ncbi:MAG: ATP-binding cassette domain-containing protein, partial [Lachnospiraceae bacterium]|nr:ATP-binding cassette domain-containing protein [Lachnospiraceae bacterium]
YNSAYIKAEKENTKFYFLNSCPGRIIEAVCVSGIIAVVCLQYGAGNVDGNFVSKMAIFVVGAFKILPLTGNLVGMANYLVYYWAGVDATYNNLMEAERVAQETREYILQHNANEEPIEEITMQNSLCIKNISWHYPNSDKQVLAGLSLEIHKNEAVALIGSSGAGKTTLSDIILGLYKPQEGNVMIDGIDIFTIPVQWSKLIGYVPQSVFLMDDTIRANVTFGLYEEDIDDEKVWDALERAQLAAFIRELPEGINTRVGERGIKFSGGQRQRIAIARALYYNPEILVLDEATSALDNETEKAVMEAIESLQGEKTLIIIAHRLSTIKNCDKIYEIVDGKAKLRNKEEVLN